MKLNMSLSLIVCTDKALGNCLLLMVDSRSYKKAAFSIYVISLHNIFLLP